MINCQTQYLKNKLLLKNAIFVFSLWLQINKMYCIKRKRIYYSHSQLLAFASILLKTSNVEVVSLAIARAEFVHTVACAEQSKAE